MNRKWTLGVSALLVMGSALSGCYDDRPGRHRPPRHDHDRPGDRPGRPGDGRPDRPGWGDGRPDRPGNDWGNGRPDRPR